MKNNISKRVLNSLRTDRGFRQLCSMVMKTQRKLNSEEFDVVPVTESSVEVIDKVTGDSALLAVDTEGNVSVANADDVVQIEAREENSDPDSDSYKEHAVWLNEQSQKYHVGLLSEHEDDHSGNWQCSYRGSKEDCKRHFEQLPEDMRCKNSETVLPEDASHINNLLATLAAFDEVINNDALHQCVAELTMEISNVIPAREENSAPVSVEDLIEKFESDIQWKQGFDILSEASKDNPKLSKAVVAMFAYKNDPKKAKSEALKALKESRQMNSGSDLERKIVSLLNSNWDSKKKSEVDKVSFNNLLKLGNKEEVTSIVSDYISKLPTDTQWGNLQELCKSAIGFTGEVRKMNSEEVIESNHCVALNNTSNIYTIESPEFFADPRESNNSTCVFEGTYAECEAKIAELKREKNSDNEEGGINSVEDFESWAYDFLKKIHGDNYDPEKAAKCINGIKESYADPKQMYGVLKFGSRKATKE